jgi:hypothetical protein
LNSWAYNGNVGVMEIIGLEIYTSKENEIKIGLSQ